MNHVAILAIGLCDDLPHHIRVQLRFLGFLDVLLLFLEDVLKNPKHDDNQHNS
jgi:hypothetical protein